MDETVDGTAGGWLAIWNTLRDELALPPAPELTSISVRLLVAVLLGALLGYDRERQDSAAGLRTHMLVALGAALMVIGAQQSGMDNADMSRVLQGIVAGIGFLGAGAIIKLNEKERIKGLTTAATIWSTAAIGVAAGLGLAVTATLATLLALVILALLPRVEQHIAHDRDGKRIARDSEDEDPRPG
jgi:putative Mg2+ transporter-C (MgtC) family protein